LEEIMCRISSARTLSVATYSLVGRVRAMLATALLLLGRERAAA
jgi:hypothetical protein